jgi:D-lyxose ketol-isomerase
VEDIINRAGGELVLQLYGSTADEEMDTQSPMRVCMDGVLTDLPAGATARLRPGESITLVPGLYHSFRAEGGTVLTGEVSAVNDDNTDNRFAEPLGRFPEIEEDEPVVHYLCNEYPVAD